MSAPADADRAVATIGKRDLVAVGAAEQADAQGGASGAAIGSRRPPPPPDSTLDDPAIEHQEPATVAPSATAATGIDINSASSDELQELPGVGPVIASRIVDHRESQGPYLAVDDLLEIKGISETTLARMRESIAVP